MIEVKLLQMVRVNKKLFYVYESLV